MGCILRELVPTASPLLISSDSHWASVQSALVRVGLAIRKSASLIDSPAVIWEVQPDTMGSPLTTRPLHRLSSSVMNWASACSHLLLDLSSFTRSQSPCTV